MTKKAVPKTKTPEKDKPTAVPKALAMSSNAGAATASATLPPLLSSVLAAMAHGAVADVAALAERLGVDAKQVRGAVDGLRRRGHRVVRRGKCQFGLDNSQRGAK